MVDKNKKKSSKTITKAEAKLTWQPHKTFELEITIPWPEVEKAYEKVLEEAGKAITIKGFRKGKAPKKMIENEVGKKSLYERVIQKLVTAKYLQAVKSHHLRPIINPKITTISLKENEDWQVKAAACETPDINLGKWEEAVKGASAQAKIWTPKSGESASSASDDKSQKGESSAQENQQKLGKIFEALLKTAQVDLSPLLIDEETNRILSSVIDQVNKLGMTVEEYLSSKNLTSDQFKIERRHQAEQTLKLEFILAKIGQEKNLTVQESDVEKAIQTAPENEQDKLKAPDQKAYIASVLRKRKTIDYLLKL